MQCGGRPGIVQQHLNMDQKAGLSAKRWMLDRVVFRQVMQHGGHWSEGIGRASLRRMYYSSGIQTYCCVPRSRQWHDSAVQQN